ncbi:MAG: amidohydrolase family protein [Candidatus Xiphinematobacter sp.]|nr:MAG: amidohydrolase family protein [Candidatus Xiphinematobacter sp.]
MKRLRARMVLTPGGPIENAAVITMAEWIVAVGPFEDLDAVQVEEEIDLGEQLLLPGLINAHCHLEYTIIGRSVTRTNCFTRWIQNLNSLKRFCTDGDYLAAVRMGLEELSRWGITSVLNIASHPAPLPRFPPLSPRVWWFFELMDVRSRIRAEALLGTMAEFLSGHSMGNSKVGLAPHSPYTASVALYRFVKFCAEKYILPVSTHLAETSEELEMFRDGVGSLFEFLQGLGRNMSDCGKKSPVALLLGEKLMPMGALLVHMNYLDEDDWTFMHNHRDFHVVHCPKTHAYFRRKKFHFDRFKQYGITTCLGTDSLASNDSLNLFEEMQLFLHEHPYVSEPEVFKMVTAHPAKAIGQAHRLGKIAPGAYADLIAIPYIGGETDAYAAIISHRHPIAWRMIHGTLPPDQ